METRFVGLPDFNSRFRGCKKPGMIHIFQSQTFIAGLPAHEQTDITPEAAMERANDRLRDQHARKIPITANLVALIFVSLSDLTQDQGQVLTSLMTHRNRVLARSRVLADYRLNELREVYLEIFCLLHDQDFRRQSSPRSFWSWWQKDILGD